MRYRPATMADADDLLRWKNQVDAREFSIGADESEEACSATDNSETLGGSAKSRLMQTDVANVLNKKTNKFHKAKVISVLESPSNKHYVRRNIITKGAVLKAKHGAKEVFVRVSSRPGQSGIVSGVILDGFTPEKEIKKRESSKKAEKKHKAKEKAPEATESTGKPAKEASAEA